MNLRRDEMAFRIIYLELLRKKELTTVFRPGNRIFPNNRGYKPGEIVTVRVIEVLGNDELEIAPRFIEEKFKIQIEAIDVVNIEALTNPDFIGSSPDVQNVMQLKYHLGLIYNKPINAFDNSEVTRIYFKYLD